MTTETLSKPPDPQLAIDAENLIVGEASLLEGALARLVMFARDHQMERALRRLAELRLVLPYRPE